MPKVLVTGGCGFLGSHICELFRKKSWEVVAFDNLTKDEFKRNDYMKPEARNHNRKLLEGMGVRVVQGDIRNQSELFEHCRDVDYICHTAAQPTMTMSWENPELDFSINVIGTFNCLEAARKFNIPIVSCNSVHCYGPDKINSELREFDFNCPDCDYGLSRYVKDPVSINEEEPLLQGTVTPLHASKMAAENYVRCYIDTFKVKAASFRLTGIYGPNQFGGEDHGWVANFAIRNILGMPLSIFGTGKQLRDVLYASDVANAFWCFYEKQIPGIYNIGGGEKTMISLIECIKLIEKITNRKSNIIYGEGRFGDLKYYVSDISKAKEKLGWEPKTLPEEGIRNLVEWIKRNEELFVRQDNI
ncbi:nucleoside-diphosphate sugar epimerase [Candidatus Pacearchaeota archaeon]|nr:nucleoside-diphosphate sugar epimerase [Candidatus Pacearchaeota archaeon]